MKVTPPRSAAVRLLALSAAAAPGSFVAVVDAYPEGAGTCAVGPDGPAFPAVRNPHVDNGMGGLEVGLFSVEVGGTALDGNSSDPVDVDLDASSGAPTVRIVADASNPLKGFLVTLQEDGKDYSSSLSAAGDDSQILTSEGLGSDGQPAVCATDVGGATHTDADDKAEVTLQLEAANIPAGEADLTVTVMERRRVWYFNSFRVNFLSSSGGNATDPPPPVGNDTDAGNATDAPTPAPGNGTEAGNATDAPTPAPGNGTDANATDAPTPMPVMNTSAPTAMPVTDSPTAMPATDSPTAMPVTEEPTLMPATDFPTMAPSSGPSAGPTDMPVTAEPTTAKPTASPTEAPSMEPSEGLPSAATTATVIGSSFATAFAGMALAWILA